MSTETITLSGQFAAPKMTSGQKLDAMGELDSYINGLSVDELRGEVEYLNAVVNAQVDDEAHDYHFARWSLAANTLYAWELEEEIEQLRDRQQELLDDAQRARVKFLPEFQSLTLAKPALVA